VPTKYGSQAGIAMVRQSNIGWPLSKKSYRLRVPQPCQVLRRSGSGAARHLNDPRDEFLCAWLRARREPLSEQPLRVPEDILFLLNGTGESDCYRVGGTGNEMHIDNNGLAACPSCGAPMRFSRAVSLIKEMRIFECKPCRLVITAEHPQQFPELADAKPLVA
jgi:hypothetical protein